GKPMSGADLQGAGPVRTFIDPRHLSDGMPGERPNVGQAQRQPQQADRQPDAEFARMAPWSGRRWSHSTAPNRFSVFSFRTGPDLVTENRKPKTENRSVPFRRRSLTRP